MLDPTAPLPDISEDEPAGPNLEFDAAFSELERNAQGKPEQQYGSTVVPAEEPDWKELIAGAWSLLERTYDLRVMAQLAVGRLQREGMVGYAETLALIRQVLETRWSQVHPQLDPRGRQRPDPAGERLAQRWPSRSVSCGRSEICRLPARPGPDRCRGGTFRSQQVRSRQTRGARR